MHIGAIPATPEEGAIGLIALHYLGLVGFVTICLVLQGLLVQGALAIHGGIGQVGPQQIAGTQSTARLGDELGETTRHKEEIIARVDKSAFYPFGRIFFSVTGEFVARHLLQGNFHIPGTIQGTGM
ncbi:hypothetical protein D3C86_1607860 [compost metagenome]